MSPLVKIRMEQIARFKVAGLKREQISQLVGLTPPGLDRIVALPEYKLLEAQVLREATGYLDKALADKAQVIRRQQLEEEARNAVPMAIRTLLAAATQKGDLRAAIAASKEILDRDPDRTLLTAKDKNHVNAVGLDPNSQALPPEQMATLIAEASIVAKETGVSGVASATANVIINGSDKAVN